jgi:ComF family protein
LAIARTKPASPESAVDGRSQATCPRCRRGSSPIASSRAVGEYAGTLRAIVQILKYDKRRSIAPRLATLMVTSGRAVLDGADAAIPVPLHWRRKWQRGFNQAALLSAHLGVAVWPALARVRATRSQVALAAPARRLNVRNAFALARRRWPWQQPWATKLEGKIVVLVDDVSTTAATLDACARVLRQSGVREVRALTAARVVGPPP